MSIFSDVVQKKRSREWFCDIWKPQRGYTDNVYIEQGYTAGEAEARFKEFEDFYESFDYVIRDFASRHVGCKWAYAYHNRGINYDDVNNDRKRHEETEHIHFVIKTENAISGSSLLKTFKFCHVDLAKYGIVNCANYLLHNTTSSTDKEKIPLIDLYCCGKGEHGDIWFPLIKAQKFEIFIPDCVMHYVYNENCTSLIDFFARFGHIVTNGSYPNLIKQSIDAWKTHSFSIEHVKEIFGMLSEDNKLGVLSAEFNKSPFDCLDMTFDDIEKFQNWSMWFEFEGLYLWYKTTTYPANDKLKKLIQLYGIKFLAEIDEEREEFRREFEKSATFDI